MRDDIGKVVAECLPNKEVFESSLEKHALYEELFHIYRNLSRKLMQDFEDLQKFSETYNIQ